jgi:hypothetical protein
VLLWWFDKRAQQLKTFTAVADLLMVLLISNTAGHVVSVVL